jgi:glycosyltransferase involved in cell wall biosynthesis
VLRQSYDDLEIIIVDDGSSDCTQDVGEMLEAAHSKVRYFRRENQGVAASRNFGAEQATGEFLYPLDADDELVPEAIEKLMKAVGEVPNCNYAFGCLEYFDTLPGEATQWVPGPVLGKNSQNYSNSLPGTSMFRRSLFSEKGVRYREMFAEDWDLWLQIFGFDGVGAYVPEVVLRYRQSRDSRDADNKYFHYQSLAHLIRNNPQRYDTPLHHFSSAVLWEGCKGFKPTYVFLPSTNSAEFRAYNGRFDKLLDEIHRRGRLAGIIG